MTEENTRIKRLKEAKRLVDEVYSELEEYCNQYEEYENLEELRTSLHWFKKTYWEIEHLEQIVKDGK